MRQLTEQEFPAPLRAGDVNLNCATRRTTRSGRVIHVSPIAFRLLECLMETLAGSFHGLNFWEWFWDRPAHG